MFHCKLFDSASQGILDSARLIRYDRSSGSAIERPLSLRAFFRWLRAWAALLRALRRGRPAPVTARNAAQETLLAGFPALAALPEELFGAFPDGLRPVSLPDCRSEEELLALIRSLEKDAGPFDWDRFLAACERQNRRAAAAEKTIARIRARSPGALDTSAARAALASLAEQFHAVL